MLVERDQRPQRASIERITKDGGRRAVSGKAARWHHPLCRTLGAHLLGRLSKGQGLGLGKEVRQEELVDVLLAVLGGVGRVGKRDEVRWDKTSALVDELVEGMLAIGARLAPEYLAGLGGDGRPIPARRLTVGLHRELLQVCGKAMQVLVIGQDGMALGTPKVDIPHVDESHEGDDVLLERCLTEVAIYVVEALEELREALGTKGNDKGKSHGGVNRVAPADPAPEAKGVLGVDAKVGDELKVGRDGHEVPLDGLCQRPIGAVDSPLCLQALEQPCLRLASVGHGLERGEGLGDDNHERGLGVEVTGLLGHVVGVDVGDVAYLNATIRTGLERLVHHNRTQVRSTYAYGDDVLDPLARDALPLARANPL